ncbi:hypothetical protein KUTeg_022461 [Tegillarca granosa]|uniref:Integrase core domain-containing protein n=1 Tax=Tegillarca granosa TaxID=220873 RepID=A0ABQ9EBJ6_TEGGR|nr:hypothetical protein KUTeg_022461 [Tegillarca granosa]
MEKEEHEIIFVCHQLGLRQKEIVEILSNLYGIFLSDRQLRRILKRYNLYRYKNRSDIVEVAEFINDQIGMSGQFHGYRDPKVVGGYFVNAVKDRGFCPQIVRGDRGTENSHVQHIQTFFHNLQQGIGRCFLYGRSTANQRIESYWCQLRKQKFEFWISFFHQLKEHGYFCGDLIEKEIIRFVFVDIIQFHCNNILYKF